MSTRMRLFLFVLIVVAVTLIVAPVYAQDAPAPPSPTLDTTPLQNFVGVLSTMLIQAAAPLIAGIVFGVLWRAYQFINAHLSITQHEFLNNLVEMAVQAAEQTGLTNQIKDTGAEKKAFAIQTVTDALAAHGYSDVSKYVPQIEALIESAINRGVQDYNAAIFTPDIPSPPPNLAASRLS